ncbi:MAG: aminomethyl-transferring glycine dehydrogenase subunit GcvPA [Actinobacteria bacterium]|nr:aminomethyl-transferring glycine dehydrogenase subunit GcvPA [Actinomycetota bacterium]
MQFAPHTDDDIRGMLEACGLASVDELYADVPAAVRLERDLSIPQGLSEMELVAEMRRLAGRNRNLDDVVSIAGGGAYDHYDPSVGWALAGRSEIYTSYTPYQPELSQGVLQALFEYQSMICELTGLDVSNASLYDGPTALVEAVNMARSATRRDRVLVSQGLDRRYLHTLESYGRGSGYRIDTAPLSGGVTSVAEVGEDIAALVVQHPSFWGNLEPISELFDSAHRAGARAIHVFDPLSLGVLRPPADVGADIAVAEGQVLGNHLNYGGPYLGVIAARSQDVRRMPGRIVGETTDVEGRPGYVLTLQAREQHIRREKAASNICTNQTLMAVAATVYMSWLGPDGLAEVGSQCLAKATYAAERLGSLSCAELVWPDADCFKEFAVRPGRAPRDVQRGLFEAGFLVGPIADAESLLVAVTERRTREEIDRFVKAFEEAAS